MAAPAPAPVKHAMSNIFSVIFKNNVGQRINGLTGECTIVDRTDEMVASSNFYEIKYTESGWGFLEYIECGQVKNKLLNTTTLLAGLQYKMTRLGAVSGSMMMQ